MASRANVRRPEPLMYTTVDLSSVAPGPRLMAEDAGILVGLIVGLPVSLAIWALIWIFAAG